MLEWEQTGYTLEDTKWQDDIIAKIEELLKRPALPTTAVVYTILFYYAGS